MYQVCKQLKLEEDVYNDSVQVYSNDRAALEAILEVKRSALSEIDWANDLKPTMSREDTFKCFEAEKKEETDLIIEAVLNGELENVKNSQDEAAQENFMEMIKARSIDKLVAD